LTPNAKKSPDLASAASGITYQRLTFNGTNYTFQAIPAGGTVHPGEAVYIRGFDPSHTPWDKPGVFTWKEHGEPRAMTNNVTIFSVRVTPDDGTWQRSENLHAVKQALPPEGMTVAAAPGTLTPFWIHDDVRLPGDYTLSLSGTGTFKIWKTQSTNGVPLLVMGQTATYDQLVSVFGSAAEMLWLEALTPGAA